jgi:MFS family permease
MNSAASSAAIDEAARLRSIAFLNWAHALDHFVLLIYPTVVIGLEVVYGRPYSELIALSSTTFIAFGIFSLPAGWLADRWSRRNMMVAFYIGCGLSLAGTAFAPDPMWLAVGMFMLGVFAAIYHPVGMAMLIEASGAKGRTLAFNGVCGNLGVSLAAGISAALATWVSWRAAFLAPAIVCIVTGIVYYWLTPDDHHNAKTRVSKPAVPLTPKVMVMLFGLFLVIALSSGLVFNVLTIALPKIVDEGMRGSTPLALVGGIATAVLVCGALAQLTVGRVVEWVPPHGTRFLRQPVGDLRDRISAAGRAGDCNRGDLRPGHRQRHDPGALHSGCLARARLCRALFHAIHQRRRGGGADRAAAQERRLQPGARRQFDHRADHVPGDAWPGVADHQHRSAARRGAASGMTFRTAPGSGPRP